MSLLKALGSTLVEKVFNFNRNILFTPCSMRNNESAKNSKGAVDSEVALCSHSKPSSGKIDK